jgi:hypothetical protein
MALWDKGWFQAGAWIVGILAALIWVNHERSVSYEKGRDDQSTWILLYQNCVDKERRDYEAQMHRPWDTMSDDTDLMLLHHCAKQAETQLDE